MINVCQIRILLFRLFIKPEQIGSRSLIESENDWSEYEPVDIKIECEEENEEKNTKQRGNYACTQQENGIGLFQFFILHYIAYNLIRIPACVFCS